MKKIKKILKKVFGLRTGIKCMVDEQAYRENMTSTMGGLTDGKRLLLISNKEDIEDIDRKLFAEGFQIEWQHLSGLINQRKYYQFYDVIVNIVDWKICFQNIEEIAGTLYQENQIAANYFVNNNLQGHIINICVAEKGDEVHEIVSIMGKNLIQGLKIALGRHDITVAGILCNEVNEEVLGWMSFLCGKYGWALSGETIDLRALKG